MVSCTGSSGSEQGGRAGGSVLGGGRGGGSADELAQVGAVAGRVGFVVGGEHGDEAGGPGDMQPVGALGEVIGVGENRRGFEDGGGAGGSYPGFGGGEHFGAGLFDGDLIQVGGDLGGEVGQLRDQGGGVDAVLQAQDLTAGLGLLGQPEVLGDSGLQGPGRSAGLGTGQVEGGDGPLFGQAAAAT